VKSKVAALWLDDRGAELVEYGVLIGFVALVALVAVHALGRSVSAIFDSVAGSV